MEQKKAIIIGAGPAGLTAAWELAEKTQIQPIVFEMSGDIGGICKTIVYKGNRIDLGGHRFFSKSDRVMNWWLNILPLQKVDEAQSHEQAAFYHQQSQSIQARPQGPDPEKENLVMLIRKRLSRIFYLRKFFDYPVSLNFNTIRNLGLWRIFKIGISYMKAMAFPIKPERSLQDFLINRFGKELYQTFFQDYTEKVWGVPCHEISAEWGAQRIKGLSIVKALLHALRSIFKQNRSLAQKNVETSLIEQFMYPKHGPGQLWEEVARQVQAKGGQIHLHYKAIRLNCVGDQVKEVVFQNQQTGETMTQQADYVFSTMPVKDLIQALSIPVPPAIRQISDGLMYRDFITVGLLLKELKIKHSASPNQLIPDNWIYMQEPEVKVGRLQIFNNWSPYLVHDPNTVWIGLEYFCNEGDALWTKPDQDYIQFAIDELAKVGIIDKANVLDAVLIRMPKTYPAYFGTYNQFGEVRKFIDQFANLFLIGRNGMHRYNNQDHSMLTAMVAVENIMHNVTSKDNLWAVNTEQEYHEEKK